MKPIIFSIIFLITTVYAQSDKEKAYIKAIEAIELMDNGEIEKSISILKECEKLDPTNYSYPYEIAFAKVLTEDYKAAIKILKKTIKYKDINSQVYQMLGNCYSYSGNTKKAIKTYEEGMKMFPEDGNLHLEKGNIYLHEKKYTKAIENYENGIKVDPLYPSNYYRLALLLLQSNDKLSGLIYGEIFMNLERTTQRTTEISELLFETYKKGIKIEGDSTTIDFCDIYLTIEDLEGGLKLPLCASFETNLSLALINQENITLNTLAEIRQNFIRNFYLEDYTKYPNILFSYHKTMVDIDLFDAYNHYLFQMGAEKEFEEWFINNEEKYDEFVDWYTKEENSIPLTKENIYKR